jgi:hypothetical protein
LSPQGTCSDRKNLPGTAQFLSTQDRRTPCLLKYIRWHLTWPKWNAHSLLLGHPRGLGKDGKTLNSSNELNTKGRDLQLYIHTFIHSLFTWAFFFEETLGMGKKKFGSLDT